jgi:hypothetical protein
MGKGAKVQKMRNKFSVVSESFKNFIGFDIGPEFVGSESDSGCLLRHGWQEANINKGFAMGQSLGEVLGMDRNPTLLLNLHNH